MSSERDRLYLAEMLTAKEPQVPWEGMIGMRNRLAHVYLRMNLKRVWEAATYQSPKLEKPLKRLLASLGPEPD